RGARVPLGLHWQMRCSTTAALRSRLRCGPPSSLFGLMAYRFDVVAVGVEDECAVVIRIVLRPQSGRAIVAASGGHGGLMKRVDLRSRLGGEGYVHAARRFLAVSDPEERLSFGAESGMRVASGLLG